jgi:uncharacterized protein (TIGR02246 family)
MKLSLGLILALVTTGATADEGADQGARRIAEESTAEWNAAFAQGKVDGIMALYADNAMLVQPNGSVSKGVSQIRDFWRTLITQGDFAMDIVDVRAEPGDTIVTTAQVSDVKTVQSPNPQVMKYRFGGVLYSVLKRQPDGSWKAQVQQWKSDRHT